MASQKPSLSTPAWWPTLTSLEFCSFHKQIPHTSIAPVKHCEGGLAMSGCCLCPGESTRTKLSFSYSCRANPKINISSIDVKSQGLPQECCSGLGNLGIWGTTDCLGTTGSNIASYNSTRPAVYRLAFKNLTKSLEKAIYAELLY